jgi:CBS domain-containing protein
MRESAANRAPILARLHTAGNDALRDIRPNWSCVPDARGRARELTYVNVADGGGVSVAAWRFNERERAMTTLGQICRRDVVVTTRDTTVADAARLMRDRHVGTLVVAEKREGSERPVGIITDRDMVVEVMAVDLNPSDITVGEVIGASLVTASENEDIRGALERMRYKGVRRLPVTNHRGHLVGIVASDDLLSALAEDVSTLAAIAPREQSREAAERRPVVL